MVGVGLYIRLGILETPTFSRLLAENRIEPAPVLEVIKRQPKSIILVARARMGEMAPAYARTRSFELSIMPGRPNIECWKLAGQPACPEAKHSLRVRRGRNVSYRRLSLGASSTIPASAPCGAALASTDRTSGIAAGSDRASARRAISEPNR